MFRIAFAALLALSLGAGTTSAQFSAGPCMGTGSYGGTFCPPVFPGYPRGAIAAPYTVHRPMRLGTYPAHLGFNSAYYGGFGGGFITSRYYVPFYGYGPTSSYSDAPSAPASSPMLPPPQRIVELSGESTATLTLEFPAPATVWLNGDLVEGEPEAVRVLTSPAIRASEKYAFQIRARWERDGQTFEYTREASLGSGDRSKLLVVSGTAVK